MAALPIPDRGIVVTHFIVSADVARSRAFYVDVLGGEAVKEGEPSIVQLANSWIIINVGGGPTEDKPEVVLEPPSDRNRVQNFLNLRVADIHAAFDDLRAKGFNIIDKAPRKNERPSDHAPVMAEFV